MDSITNIELTHRVGKVTCSEFSCFIGMTRLRVIRGCVDVVIVGSETVYESIEESDTFDMIFDSFHEIYYKSQQVGHLLFPDSYEIVKKIINNLDQEQYCEYIGIN